jgi:hypothetical protein
MFTKSVKVDARNEVQAFFASSSFSLLYSTHHRDRLLLSPLINYTTAPLRTSPSVQGAIGKQLSQRFNRRVTAVGAGRTDCGVHARGQVSASYLCVLLVTSVFCLLGLVMQCA